MTKNGESQGTASAAEDRAAHSHDDGHSDGSARWELGFAIASGVTYAAGIFSEYALDLPMVGVPLAFFLATYFFGGYFTVRTAITSTLRGKFEVDFLMLVAALGAALIGRWGEGAVLLFLFSLGHALEEFAMSRASKSIEALAELAPRTALVRRGADDPVEVPVEEIVVGDVVVVRPNSRISSDGFVSTGVSAVDQSAVTGESIPVEKEPVPDVERALRSPEAVPPAHRIFAGTLNGAGVLEVIVTATKADSTLSKVVELVRNADQSKSPTQRFIDRFQRWYVPAVILGVAVTLLVAMAGFGRDFSDAFYLAITVLVAASPCALAIATPAGVLAGVARAARAGLLVKGGGPLEILGQVRAMAFDKTGTLTWGAPRVVGVTATEGADETALTSTLLAVESLSDHPLAAAIVRDLSPHVPERARLRATDLSALTGRGVRARVDGDTVEVGNARMFTEQGVDLPPSVAAAMSAAQEAGQTVMIVRRAGAFIGVVGVMDTPRQESRPVLESLRRSGVERFVMISGDNQRVADAVGRHVGVDMALGELMPDDKVTHISRLGETARVAMVGDGVNDAPAMARADVAIAMGAAGSAVALETCDIALMSDDLGRLPFAVRLSREASRIIRQNLVASLAVVAFLVIATFFGLNIGAVVLIHEGSTLIVVANALRLLNFERGGEHAGIPHEKSPTKQPVVV